MMLSVNLKRRLIGFVGSGRASLFASTACPPAGFTLATIRLASRTASVGSVGVGVVGQDDLKSFVLETKSWSVKAHLQRSEEKHGAASRAALTDEDVEKVADYAHLELPPRGSLKFEKIKEDLASVLAASAAIKDFLAARKSTEEGAKEPLPFHEQYRRQLSPEEAKMLAETRMAELRKDEAKEGGDAEALLKHAARRSGQFFVVPRTVEG
jgi:Asp-tRNA(Asn)/Glu-tRNA(Gln) amidotransferase C subunit